MGLTAWCARGQSRSRALTSLDHFRLRPKAAHFIISRFYFCKPFLSMGTVWASNYIRACHAGSCFPDS